MSLPSQACCNMPPVEVDYTPKGSDITIQGLNTYKTGSPTSTTAILLIGDIFGTGSQTLQGADILAYGGNYQVFVPDFLRGQYADHSLFPANTPEKQKAVGAYFQGPGNFANALALIPGVLREIEEKAGGKITKWAAVGLCWGGKVATIASGTGTPFVASVSAHPAVVDPKDGPNIKIPFALLASMHEDAEAIKNFGDSIGSEKYIETFSDMPHGWMARRANLNDPVARKGYRRGYETALSFLHKYL